MSLQSRLAAFITAVGTDIKAVNTRIDELPGAGGFYIVDNGDGTWTATSWGGASIVENGDGSWTAETVTPPP